ncbi:TFIIS N-terminal domain-containing protein [Psidium guajava]|nr:TFIIS N-terminal domain-containing protein [Psidium guajava]
MADSLDYWRHYFRTANCDIFDIIDSAIMVAASDCPKEFRSRRDRIAERLFTCRLTRCSGCDRVELAVPSGDEDDGLKSGIAGEGCDFEAGGSKESKVNSSRDDHGELFMNQESNYSYGEAEALTDEMEEESQILGEVLRIKEILLNSDEESVSELYESLTRLQLMALTVGILKATGIGKAVNPLRKHRSKQIGRLSQTLIMSWKTMVEEWMQAAPPPAGGTPDSVNPSSNDEEEEEEEEEGLPSPPLDEGAFFAPQTSTMELSGFFDGMDEDGNPRTGNESAKNCRNGRKPFQEKENVSEQQRERKPDGAKDSLKDNRNQQLKKREDVAKPNGPTNASAGQGRHTNLNAEQKVNKECKLQPRRLEKISAQRRMVSNQKDGAKYSEEDAVQMKLEATKRKLQESYQQAENAKRQRTIQVMDLHDLPKQSLGHRNLHMRPGNQNRHWANGRR